MSHLREDEQRLLRSCNGRDDFWPTNMVMILSRLEEERDKAEKVSELLADSTKALTEARAEVVRLKERDRWIPVSKELPDKPKWVWVLTAERPDIPETRSYVEGRWISWMGGHYGFDPATVTHWRPLPSPPAESAEQHCPSCGYTKEDAAIYGDHRLCKNAGNAPWESAEQSEGGK